MFMESQAVHVLFLQLMVMLLTARLFTELFARLQSPPVVGELLAGVIIGPSLLGWLEPSQVIRLQAEIGIILLLFEVGLETDIRQLAKTGWKALLVAVSGLVWPFFLGFGLSHWLFERNLLEALFIGGTLTATRIGITVRVLTDLKRHHSREAQVVLGAAVIDDTLGVVLLAVLYEFSRAGVVDWTNAGKVIGFIAAFFVLAPVLAKLISRVIRRFALISQTDGLIPTLIVSLVLFFARLAHAMGAPELLGGFCLRAGPVPALFPALRHGAASRPGLRRPHRKPDATHRPPVRPHLLRDGGTFLGPACGGLVFAFHLVVFAVPARRRGDGQAAGRLAAARTLGRTLRRRHRHDSAGRSGADLRRTGQDIGDPESRGLCRPDHRHRPDDSAVALAAERTLPTISAYGQLSPP